MIRILARIRASAWAIQPDVLETILMIAERQNMTPEAVATQIGRPLNNTYDVEMRGSVAILPVMGPLFRYANLFTDISGATSYDLLARDFAAAVADRTVSAILLNIDSPGGEVTGLAEFADQIFNARGSKPIVAYVGGSGASAAYWIASAADEVVISETSGLGSIGTVAEVVNTKGRDEKAGIVRHEFVSSQSPNKRLDPATPDGASRIQARIDAMSDVFIAKVARNRGISTDQVLQEFGQGDIFIGQAAVTAGLADRVGSYEGVISELQQGVFTGQDNRTAAAGSDNKGHFMSDKNTQPAAKSQAELDAEKKAADDAAAAKVESDKAAEEAKKKTDDAAAAATAATAVAAPAAASDSGKTERARVQAILGHDEAKERPTLAQHLALETDMTVEAASALLAKSAKEPKGASDFARAMAGTKNPAVGADTESGSADSAASDACIDTARAMGLAPGKK